METINGLYNYPLMMNLLNQLLSVLMENIFMSQVFLNHYIFFTKNIGLFGKYDLDSNKIWTKEFKLVETNSFELSDEIITDFKGENIYVCGLTTGTFTD